MNYAARTSCCSRQSILLLHPQKLPYILRRASFFITLVLKKKEEEDYGYWDLILTDADGKVT